MVCHMAEKKVIVKKKGKVKRKGVAKKKGKKKEAPQEGKKMRVSDLIVTDEFKTIENTADGTHTAKQLMGIPRGVVLVMNEDERVLGVITAREFLKRIVDGDNPVELSAEELMNEDIMEICITDLLDDVVPRVTEHDPYAVVVVDEEGTFQGYFSPKDYQEALARINYVHPQMAE